MNELLPYYEETIEEFKHLKRWKDNVSRALWTIFVALVGVFVKLIFFA